MCVSLSASEIFSLLCTMEIVIQTLTLPTIIQCPFLALFLCLFPSLHLFLMVISMEIGMEMAMKMVMVMEMLVATEMEIEV